MSGREYSAIRPIPIRFLTAVGPFEPTVDRVVGDGSREIHGYLIVPGHARRGETVIRSTGRYEIVEGG